MEKDVELEQVQNRLLVSSFPEAFYIFGMNNFVDLNMYQCGMERCKPGHSFGPVARTHYLFHYILSGKGTLDAHNEKNEAVVYHLENGQGFLLFPGQIASYYADLEDPWTYMWIEFDGLKVKQALENSTLSYNQAKFVSRSDRASRQLAIEMNEIIQNPKESPYFLIGHLFLFFSALLEATKKLQKEKTSLLSDFYVQEAISYIENNFERPMTIEELAEAIGLNRNYFGKLFQRKMGKSPQQFLIQYRMNKAAEYLLTTDWEISAISCHVGYENPLHFSKAFKKVYGKSPRIWRAGQQKDPDRTQSVFSSSSNGIRKEISDEEKERKKQAEQPMAENPREKERTEQKNKEEKK